MSTKTKIRPGAIRLADSDKVILVDYEQEKYQLREDGTTGELLSKMPGTQKLKVQSVSSASTARELDDLAQALTEKCKLIKAAAVPTVRALLDQLYTREVSAGGPDRKLPAGNAVGQSSPREGEARIRAVHNHDAQGSRAAEDKAERKEKKKTRKEKMSSEIPTVLLQAWLHRSTCAQLCPTCLFTL